ncbi:hypothetical protein LTS09_018005 [Friedmanniomyces endolithicus]|nr:hypothetical protein LTS09_018005 [Friedmanniomyces endolithicus]
MNANSGEEVIPLVKTGIRSQAFRDGRLDSNVANREGIKGVRLPTQAWRRTLSLGAIATGLVLLLNVAFLVWLRVDREYTNGFLGVSTITKYTGSCHVTKSAVFWSSLVINILSTVLLAASSTCAQLITSPTRAALDQAHKTRKWLDIGVPSVRNLAGLENWKVLCWSLLYLSAGPIHLLTDACVSYNSVVFYTTAANEYNAIVVTHDFLTGAPSNLGWYKGVPGNGVGDYELLGGLAQVQTDVGNMTHLSNEECIKAYGSTELESGYGTVLLVTSAASNDSAIGAWNHDPEFRSLYGASYAWLCGDITNEACDFQSLLANPENWTFPELGIPPWDGAPCLPEECRTVSATIDFCLAYIYPERCAVKASSGLLIIVIVCNFIKLLCIAATVRFTTSLPLATLGDAIGSFLERPEPRTMDDGPATIDWYRSAQSSRASTINLHPKQSFGRHKLLWWAACGAVRWSIGLIL